MKFSLALLAAICIFASSASFAQDRVPTSGDVGLAASLQSEHVDIFVPIWIMERMVLAPALGIVIADGVGTELRTTLALRYYFSKTTVAPYIGPKVGAIHFSPDASSAESTTDVLAGLAFGGECFIHPRFSVGVEAQLNFAFSDANSTRFGNPGSTNINTGSAVFATFYF